MTSDKDYRSGLFFALVTGLCFSIVGIVDKVGSTQTNNPFIFSTQSLLFSLLFSFIFSLFYFKGLPIKEIKKIPFLTWGLVILIGILASGLAILLRFIGLKESTGTFATLSQIITTSVTVILAWIFLKERLSKIAWVFFIIIVISMYFVSVGKLAFLDIKQGDKFILLGALFIGIANIFSKKAVHIINPILLSLGRFLFGFIFLLLIISFFIGNKDILKLSNYWVILSGLLWSVNVSGFNLAIKRIGVTFTTSLLMMGPVITMILEYLLLGYQFTLVQIIAAMVVIVSGIAIILTKD